MNCTGLRKFQRTCSRAVLNCTSSKPNRTKENLIIHDLVNPSKRHHVSKKKLLVLKYSLLHLRTVGEKLR